MKKHPRSEKEKTVLPDGQRSVSTYLKGIKFKKKLMGVDEADVWRKIEKICELYEAALEDERARAEDIYPLGGRISAKAEANRVWDDFIRTVEQGDQTTSPEEREEL